MVRLCTHCKKADTEYLEYKYCYTCYLKCLDWLDKKAEERPEPDSVVRRKVQKPEDVE